MRSAIVVLSIAAFFCASPGAFAQNALVLEGAVVFDGVASRPQKNSIIVIENGRISGFGPRKEVIIPDGAKRMNLRGKYIIPGLIDGHVHYGSPRDLLQMLAWGVTSANCMFESTDKAVELTRLTLQDTSRSPQIYATAPIFSVEHGARYGEGYPLDSSLNRFPATPEEARAQVRKARASGVKRIELVYDSMEWCRDGLPRMKKEVMEALIDEASNQKLFTSVLAPKPADAGEALEAGAMSLASGLLSDYVDASTTGTILTHNVYYVTTFSAFEFLADPQGFMKGVLADKRFRSSLSPDVVKEYSSAAYSERIRKQYPNGSFVQSHLSILRDNLVSLVRNYVLVVMGSDLDVLPGIGAHLELEYMVKAGLTPYQALIAATTFGGQYLGAATKVGTIETGRQADLVILNADPIADIRNTRNIKSVMKHGKFFDPKELLKAANR